MKRTSPQIDSPTPSGGAALTRRQALSSLALVGAALTLQAGAQQAAPRSPAQPRLELTGWETLKVEWSTLEFVYDNEDALLVRVPAPVPENTRPLRLERQGEAVYLVAYTLTCRHNGCPVDLPNAQGQLICPCHASTFYAGDGSLMVGPARRSLLGLTLALEQEALWVVGRFELES